MTHEEFVQLIREALGPSPFFEARSRIPEALLTGEISLNYDWIRYWDALGGLEFADGQEFITLWIPRSDTNI